MLLARVMPCLLVSRGRLVKTVRFKNPRYIGDPVNAIKIFNEKEVDELVLLDIDAARAGSEPNFDLIARVTNECFMPLTYGGGIRNASQIGRILSLGVEKVVLNSLPRLDPVQVRDAATKHGCQCIVVSIDITRGLLGRPRLHHSGGMMSSRGDLVDYIRKVEDMGTGEIFVNDIDRDGTWEGFDIQLLRTITMVATVPVIACGGAGSIADIGKAVIDGGASAVAIGSMAVFQGKDLGVLINFPPRAALQSTFA